MSEILLGKPQFTVLKGNPLPPVRKGRTEGMAAKLRTRVEVLVEHMEIGDCFYVPDEKYARHASDYAKTRWASDGKAINNIKKLDKYLIKKICRVVTFREIPSTNCQYGVWRIQ